MHRLLMLLQDAPITEEVVDKVIEGAKDGGNWLFNAGLAGTFTVLILVSIIFWRLWANGERKWEKKEKALTDKHEGLIKSLRTHFKEDREKLIDLVQEKDGKLAELHERYFNEVKELVMNSHAQNVDFTTTLHSVSETLRGIERELERR